MTPETFEVTVTYEDGTWTAVIFEVLEDGKTSDVLAVAEGDSLADALFDLSDIARYVGFNTDQEDNT